MQSVIKGRRRHSLLRVEISRLEVQSRASIAVAGQLEWPSPAMVAANRRGGDCGYPRDIMATALRSRSQVSWAIITFTGRTSTAPSQCCAPRSSLGHFESLCSKRTSLAGCKPLRAVIVTGVILLGPKLRIPAACTDVVPRLPETGQQDAWAQVTPLVCSLR